MIEIENKVDRLEEAMMRTHMMLQGLSMEMNTFKNEIRQDTREFKRQTQASIENLSKEIKDFKDEMKLSSKNMNKKWEELVMKMGTMVEDIVAPNIAFIAKKYFNLENGKILVRSDAYHIKTNQRREFDTIAVYNDKVILNETKSNTKTDEAKKFIKFIKSAEFFEYFPEYKGRELIPILSSLYIHEDTVKYLSNNKIYAMAMKEDTMDILNFDDIK